MPSPKPVNTRALSPLKRTLRRVFNLEEFRPGQTAVIESIMAGHHTLAVMPTGAGKSLCYQLPALHLPGMTLVVSPLISLMQDQTTKLTELGVDAWQLNSAITAREEASALQTIEDEQAEFILTTPERLVDPEFLAALKGKTIDLVVVDEAHCISQWGHDFRPAYLELASAVQQLGMPPVLALTATASREVAEDIVRQLGLRQVNVINTGIYRPNLQYDGVAAENDTERDRLLVEAVSESLGTGIVYTATVRQAKAVTALLQSAGVAAECYHGQLGARVRREVQERFMDGAVRVIAATNAFGLGIDKPDIRFVIHYGMPGSLDAYYQESGRGGRDGAPARALLLYHPSDRRTHVFFMAGRYPSFDHIRAVYTALERLRAADGPVPLGDIQREASGVAKSKVRVILSLLADWRIVRQHRPVSFSLRRQGLVERDFGDLAESYKARHERDRAKLDAMIVYAQTAMCRWKKLVDYFGESVDWETCGHCDNCRKNGRDDVPAPAVAV